MNRRGRESLAGQTNYVSSTELICIYRSRKGEVGEEIFDMLLSFTDFLTFKQAMLDYKAVSACNIASYPGSPSPFLFTHV